MNYDEHQNDGSVAHEHGPGYVRATALPAYDETMEIWVMHL
jgi:hypothetical protein